MNPTPLSILFSSILLSCGDKFVSDKAEPITHEYDCEFGLLCDEIEYAVALSPDEFADYLDFRFQLSAENCQQICTDEGVGYNLCTCSYEGLNDEDQYAVTCTIGSCAMDGRAHGGVKKASRVAGPTPMACWLARVFHAEASSVGAFLQLRAELEGHGAPMGLLDRCFSAAQDEVRHARMASKLCDELGGRAPPLSFGDIPQRSLVDLAIDNAMEGCVFETYAALRAHHQARHATDERIQQMMRIIAIDETRHAQLAWDIHHWLMSKLDEAEKERVRRAQAQAFVVLVESARREAKSSIAGELGLPRVELALALSSELAA